MWWTNAGFGRFVILNELKERCTEASDGKKTHVHQGVLTKLQVSGMSRNTLSGTRKSVFFNLLKQGPGRPESKAQVNLSWRHLYGPPIPDSWSLDYEISAPDNEQKKVVGRLPLDTPHGKRPMVKFTFRYFTPEGEDDSWYAVEAEHFDWRKNTWTAAPVTRIGDKPAAHAS